MPTTLDLSAARSLLRTRDRLYADGLRDRDIHTLVEAGRLHRVRQGRYVTGEAWDGCWAEGRHLLEVAAARMNAGGSGPVFCGASAAVVHGLPLYRHTPELVHVVIDGSRHTRRQAGIHWHSIEVDPADVVEIDGIRCTSLERTAFDLARSLGEAAAVCVLDAALRTAAVSGQTQDPALVDAWRSRMRDRAGAGSGRGVRKARGLIEFADGRAQLPGESVSRLHLRTLGFAAPLLQVHVVGPEGQDYWIDFGFRGARKFGEFDGKGKYIEPALRRGLTIEQALLAEKCREDDVRGVTGWGFARWENEHISTAATLGERLAAFGVYPPG